MEEALEETNPGHRHQSGFYQQTGHSVMAGGRRRAFIVLATEVIKSASNIRNTKMLIQVRGRGAQDAGWLYLFLHATSLSEANAGRARFPLQGYLEHSRACAFYGIM